MSNQNQPNNNNVQNNQNQKQAAQPQVDIADILQRQQVLIESLSADRDALVKNATDLTSVIKELKAELTEVKASLNEEKIRAQIQQEAEAKAMALVDTFKTAVEAGGIPGVPAVNGNNSGSYDRLHYLFKFGDKRRRGIF